MSGINAYMEANECEIGEVRDALLAAATMTFHVLSGLAGDALTGPVRERLAGAISSWPNESSGG